MRPTTLAFFLPFVFSSFLESDTIWDNAKHFDKIFFMFNSGTNSQIIVSNITFKYMEIFGGDVFMKENGSTIGPVQKLFITTRFNTINFGKIVDTDGSEILAISRILGKQSGASEPIRVTEIYAGSPSGIILKKSFTNGLTEICFSDNGQILLYEVFNKITIKERANSFHEFELTKSIFRKTHSLNSLGKRTSTISTISVSNLLFRIEK